jgi:hypothetical protein
LIDVEALEKKFNETTLLSCKGDFITFCTDLTRLRPDINVEMNSNHCTEKKFGIQFFRGAEAWPNKDWITTIKAKHQDCLLGDIPNVPKLITKLGKIVFNMQAEETWMILNDSARKDIVLTSILKKQKKFEKKLEASHSSGCYMPHPHDHSAWKKRRDYKKVERESYKKTRRGKRDVNPKSKNDDKNDSDKSPIPTSLQLKDSVKSVLVTECMTSQADAERISDLILTKAGF